MWNLSLICCAELQGQYNKLSDDVCRATDFRESWEMRWNVTVITNKATQSSFKKLNAFKFAL